MYSSMSKIKKLRKKGEKSSASECGWEIIFFLQRKGRRMKDFFKCVFPVLNLFIFLFILTNTSLALTKGFEVMLMNPATDGGSYFSVWGSKNSGALKWSLGTLAVYSYRPMQLIQNGNRVRGILDNTAVQHFYGHFGIIDRWLSIGADVPVGWWADFTDPNVTSAVNQNKFVVGDIYVNLKSELVRSKYFGLAVRPFITIPTGYAAEFFGNGNVTGGGDVIAEFKPFNIWSIALNAGVQGRERFDFRDIEKSNQLEVGLGTSVQIITPLSLYAEILSTTRLSGPFKEKVESPTEARGGIKWAIGKSGFLASLGGAGGILYGSGVPTYRIFAGLDFSTSRREKKEQPAVIIEKPNYAFLKNYTIHFETDSAELDAVNAAKLAELSDRIRNEKVCLNLDGYVDSTGKELFNKLLSKKRAEKVAWFLGLMGIDSSRMKAFGRGKRNPAGNNKTSEGRAKNRRVEISAIQ